MHLAWMIARRDRGVNKVTRPAAEPGSGKGGPEAGGASDDDDDVIGGG